jgi:hypothetical protein
MPFIEIGCNSRLSIGNFLNNDKGVESYMYFNLNNKDMDSTNFESFRYNLSYIVDKLGNNFISNYNTTPWGSLYQKHWHNPLFKYHFIYNEPNCAFTRNAYKDLYAINNPLNIAGASISESTATIYPE